MISFKVTAGGFLIVGTAGAMNRRKAVQKTVLTQQKITWEQSVGPRALAVEADVYDQNNTMYLLFRASWSETGDHKVKMSHKICKYLEPDQYALNE